MKGARFVRFCDAFNIPLITFEDVAGVPAGHGPGVRRHHPARRKAAVRIRRSHSPEDHRHYAQGVRRRILRHGIQAHSDRHQLRLSYGRDCCHGTGRRGQHRLSPRTRYSHGPRCSTQEKTEEFIERFANPFAAAERGFIDDVIEPHETRPKLAKPCGCSKPKWTQRRERSTATSRFRITPNWASENP